MEILIQLGLILSLNGALVPVDEIKILQKKSATGMKECAAIVNLFSRKDLYFALIRSESKRLRDFLVFPSSEFPPRNNYNRN